MTLGKNPAFFILFIVCSTIQLLYPSEIIAVLPFILAAITTGFMIYTDALTIKRLVFILYTVLCIIEPRHLTFMPIVLYVFYAHENRMWSLLAVFPFLLMPTQLVDVQSMVFLAFILSVMAVLLKNQHLINIKLKQALTDHSDSMRELTLHLNEQNRLLMSHQDDEIHVATLKERNRIAREIHDHVGHQLSRVLLQIGAGLTQNKTDPTLLSMKETLDSAMDNLRKSVHDLHDTSIELETQIHQVVAEFNFCPVKLTLHLDSAVNAQIKVALIAILKESFSNVAKHSTAPEVKVSLIEHPSFYQFIIHDNGHSPTTIQNQFFATGIGLKNIEQRVTELKGHFLIRTQNGFELFITLPKP